MAPMMGVGILDGAVVLRFLPLSGSVFHREALPSPKMGLIFGCSEDIPAGPSDWNEKPFDQAVLRWAIQSKDR